MKSPSKSTFVENLDVGELSIQREGTTFCNFYSFLSRRAIEAVHAQLVIRDRVLSRQMVKNPARECL